MGEKIAKDIFYILKSVSPIWQVFVATIGYKAICKIKSEKVKGNILAILTYLCIMYIIVAGGYRGNVLYILSGVAFVAELLSVNIFVGDNSFSNQLLTLVSWLLYLLCIMALISLWCH